MIHQADKRDPRGADHADTRSGTRRLPRALAATLTAALLAACGGGGGGGDAGEAAAPAPQQPGGGTTAAPPALPAPTTQTVPAGGGRMSAALAGGARATLDFPPAALATDTAVTVTPVAGHGDEWTRFRLDPAPAALRAPLTLRLSLPAGVAPAQVPVLQLLTAEGPLPLVTHLADDGELVAELQMPLARVAGQVPAAASPVRMRALSATAVTRPLADGPAADDGATVVGARFLATCEAPGPVLDDALRVIQHAASAHAVNVALRTMALVADRCARPGVLDEAGLLRVNQALQAVGDRLPGLYAGALAAWRAANYLVVETEFETFVRGLRRVLALCAAARELGADLACPAAADLEGEFLELAYGFVAASNERQHLAGLRSLFDRLLPLPAEAALFGLPAAERDLRESVAYIADRLMERAYALCSHGELFEWRVYVEHGGHSTHGTQTLARAIAHCGVQGEVVGLTREGQGDWQRGDALPLLPGTLAGNGRTGARTLTLPFNGRVVVALNGPALRCARVIGMPETRDEALELRVGSVVVGRIPLVASGDADATSPREAALDLPRLLADAGRAPDSTDPVTIDVWREAAGPLHCFDSGGGLLEMQTAAQRLFSIVVEPPRPSGWSGTVRVRMDERLRVGDGDNFSETTVALDVSAPATALLPPGAPADLVLAPATGTLTWLHHREIRTPMTVSASGLTCQVIEEVVETERLSATQVSLRSIGVLLEPSGHYTIAASSADSLVFATGTRSYRRVVREQVVGGDAGCRPAAPVDQGGSEPLEGWYLLSGGLLPRGEGQVADGAMSGGAVRVRDLSGTDGFTGQSRSGERRVEFGWDLRSR
ncbi:MAG: hypothetical protein KF683_13435 [Rubrivivax sp.]|nr:hypothetical protein [Rubrivivax sp.]